MSIMEIGDFTVWSDPETMTTTVSVDGRTEQVTQTVGEMLEILGRYVTQLQDENAKLREQGADMDERRAKTFEVGKRWMAKAARFESENTKLRELVADMRPFVEGAMDDEYCPAPECPFTELCTENQVCMASSGFHYRMRELGVEVD